MYVCVLMVVARESVFCLGYFPGFCCYFSCCFCTVLLERMSTLSFYIFFESRLIHTLFPLSDWEYQPEQVPAGICLFDTCWLLFLHWVVMYLFIVHSVHCAYFY